MLVYVFLSWKYTNEWTYIFESVNYDWGRRGSEESIMNIASLSVRVWVISWSAIEYVF